MIAKPKTCVIEIIRSWMHGTFMDDEIAYRPLESLTMSELGKLQRMATRYSEMVREHAYLVGLMNLAMRTGETNLLATTKKRLAETELECNECSLALRLMRKEMLSAPGKDGEDRLATVDETRQYATA
ncbi:MAG TPA: hypothetical protein VGF82_04545 [Terracidiphilus sp.]